MTFRNLRSLRALDVAVLIFVVIVAAELAGVGARAVAQPAGREVRCGPGATHAVIAGEHVCLASGRRCSVRLDSRYHRYGFHCHRGTLVRDSWAPLRRPLRLPAIDPGTPCPRSTARAVDVRYGPAVGKGPVYLVNLGPEAFVDLTLSREDGGWRYHKVIPVRFDRQAGAVLARGRQVDGANELRFGPGPQPSVDGLLLFKGWFQASGPRYVRVRAPGCYAVQLDGLRFQDVIVFEVKL